MPSWICVGGRDLAEGDLGWLFVLARLKLTAQARAFSGGGTAQRAWASSWRGSRALVVGVGAGGAHSVPLSAEGHAGCGPACCS